MNYERHPAPEQAPAPQHKRRVRYTGKNPRRFEDKYKERNPELYPEAIAKVSLPARRPPACTVNHDRRDSRGVESTAGRSCRRWHARLRGHARELLPKLQPGGRLIGLDVDPSSCRRRRHDCALSGSDPKPSWHIEATLPDSPRSSPRQLPGVDMVLADLGVSSMQIDDPGRGFQLGLQPARYADESATRSARFRHAVTDQCRRPGHHP